MSIIREQVVDDVITTHSSRVELAMFSKDASDRIGGIFVSVGAFQSNRAQVARTAARVEGMPRQTIENSQIPRIRSSFSIFGAPCITLAEQNCAAK